jgi:cation transport ATPase
LLAASSRSATIRSSREIMLASARRLASVARTRSGTVRSSGRPVFGHLRRVAFSTGVYASKGGSETEITVIAVLVGNLVVVRPGEWLPRRLGFLGAGAANESWLTNESLPVENSLARRW